MIAVTNLMGAGSRSHRVGSGSELLRRVLSGTSAQNWIRRGVAPIDTT
ncbi:hypothetical protein [Ktedonobacter racemifer]|nr:hypothetical protein [Ktedonobacter racemifer]